MSALGHEQICAVQIVMSALPPKADMARFAGTESAIYCVAQAHSRRMLTPIMLLYRACGG